MGLTVVKDHHLAGPQGCDRDLFSVHRRHLQEVGPDVLGLSSLIGIVALAVTDTVCHRAAMGCVLI